MSRIIDPTPQRAISQPGVVQKIAPEQKVEALHKNPFGKIEAVLHKKSVLRKVRAWKQGGNAGNPKEYDKGTVKPRYLIAQALILVPLSRCSWPLWLAYSMAWGTGMMRWSRRCW